MGVFNRLVRFC